MNQFGSHPNHENCSLRISTSGPLRGTAGREFFNSHPLRSGGAPSGAAVIIEPDGDCGKNPAS